MGYEIIAVYTCDKCGKRRAQIGKWIAEADYPPGWLVISNAVLRPIHLCAGCTEDIGWEFAGDKAKLVEKLKGIEGFPQHLIE